MHGAIMRTILAASLWLLLPHIPAQADEPALTAESLPDLLEAAVSAFNQGDFAAAADWFRQIDARFSNEPEFEEAQLTERLLPLWGFAELRSGAPEKAADAFERFLEDHPEHEQADFVLYGAATALRQAGHLQKALEMFADYEARFPGRTETALARLQRSEILFETGRDDKAIELLTAFSESDASPTLRTQARLRALQEAVKQHRLETAAGLLFTFSWKQQAMPEAAVLSFSAMEAGDLFMEDDHPEAALRAYRLALPRDALMAAQRERIEETRMALRRARSPNQAPGYRYDYHRGLLERMERQIAALEEAEDYTPNLLLRRGQAYLLADRAHEAWLIFEWLALDKSIDQSLREEAHYRWILASNALSHWEESLTIARNYIDRYPASDLLAEAVYLIAQAHAEQRRHEETIAVLNDLIDDFPEHPLRQRWLFKRGFTYVLTSEFPAARDDFIAAARIAPETSIAADCELWEGLAWFFEGDYATALDRFSLVAEDYAGHPIEGEAIYRKATTLYAKQEYEKAIAETLSFLEDFERHQREPEARILLGDLWMGKGELDRAFAAFDRITPEYEEFYPHAIFQQGKILQAQQEYERKIEHFSAYLDRAGELELGRLSEALYWIGWAHKRLGNPERALPLFLETLHVFGNSPEAAEIQSILKALHQLHGSVDRRLADLSPDARRILDAEDFIEWLEAERDEAIESGRFTWFANLSLYLAEIRRNQGAKTRSDAILFEIANTVSKDRMPPGALAKVGLLYVDRDLAAAEDYLEGLLKDHPDSPERAPAYYGLARRLFDRGEYTGALEWLRRFQNETPAHDLAGDTGLLAGEILLHLDRPGEAVRQFEAILELRHYRGRRHAVALDGLGRTMEKMGEKEKAIAYYQRVYTLYRAFPSLVAKAYFRSGDLFARLGDDKAARESFLTLVEGDEFKESDYRRKALARLESLPPPAETEAKGRQTASAEDSQ